MRTDSIIIGGQKYPVKGLTVSQSLSTDLEVYDARQAQDKDKISALRLKRMALCLQNGNAFLPDPVNPQGQIGAATMTAEKVIKWLDSDVFSDMVEFYNAESIIMKLADPLKKDEQEPGKGVAESVGESLATG